MVMRSVAPSFASRFILWMASRSCCRVMPSWVATPAVGLPGLLQILRGIASVCRVRAAFGGFGPAGGGERQYFVDQAAGLRHHLVIALGGRAQDEFRDAGIDIIGDAADDRRGVADREVIPWIAAGALPVRLEQRPQCRIVHPPKAERDAGAVMILVDRAALLRSSCLDRGDDLLGLLRRLGARLPARAEARGAPYRRLGRTADPHRQIRLHRLWRNRRAR